MKSNKSKRNLSADDKKRLIDAKRKKEVARTLLPDPPEKISRGSSNRSYIEVSDLSSSDGKRVIEIDVSIESTDEEFLVADDLPAVSAPEEVSASSNIDTSPLLIVVPNQEESSRITSLEDIRFATELENGDSDPEETEQWELQPFISREVAKPNPATIPDDVDPSLRHLLDENDRLNDLQLRQTASPDLLTFDWRNEPGHFTGKREKFTGCAGPTQCVKNLHPVDIFLKIWDSELLDSIVTETNAYANRVITSTDQKEHSRLKKWTPTDRQEILTFFAFLIYQGVAPLPVEKDYFKTSGRLGMPGLAKIFTYNRFILLKKFLHFNSEPPEKYPANERELCKLGKIPEHLNLKFSELYTPGQNIAIDESLLHWSGRLTMAQKIANKAAKVGIKSYELCESSTGYLWKFIIYCGADKTGRDGQTGRDEHDGQDSPDRHTGQDGRTDDIEPDGHIAKVVYQLATPLFGKGYTLVMDNFYNSPLLARCLKKKQTDVLGTLRISREFVPESLKSVEKSELKVGEVVYSQTSDLSVLLWRDANLVSMISTYHPVEIGAKEKYGSWRYKPQAVLDYNSLMGGVDKKDQLLASFPIERIRNQVWYKKLFRRLLNVSILNVQIIHSAQNKKMSPRQFRIALAEELLTRFQPPNPSTNKVKVLAGGKRPILSGNHFVIKGPSRHPICVWCRRREGKVSRTVYKCEQCSVSLCFEPCFKDYHTVRD